MVYTSPYIKNISLVFLSILFTKSEIKQINWDVSLLLTRYTYIQNRIDMTKLYNLVYVWIDNKCI